MLSKDSTCGEETGRYIIVNKNRWEVRNETKLVLITKKGRGPPLIHLWIFEGGGPRLFTPEISKGGPPLIRLAKKRGGPPLKNLKPKYKQIKKNINTK